MTTLPDNSGPPWLVRVTVEQAVAEWLNEQPTLLAHPVDDRSLGELASLVTRRLVEAGLIEAESGKADNGL